MVTLQTADKALKNFYLDAITKEIDTKASPFLAKIEKTSANVVGKGVSKIIKIGLNGGIGAGTETGNLPESRDSDYITLNASLKNLYGTIEISDKAIRASANDEGAFVNLLNDEMDSLVKSAKFNFSRMLFGQGNGLLANIASVGSDSYMVTSTSGFNEGMYVDFWKSGVKTHENLKVTLINRDTNRIYVTGRDIVEKDAPTPGTEVRACGSEAGYELTGLGALFSQGSIYGMDRTTSYMQPYVQNSVGELTEESLQLAIDEIEERSGSKVNFILCSWGVRRALTRVFKENPAVLSMMDMGDNQHVLAYNGIPIVVDRFCPENAMYLLNTNDFKICQLCDWQWMEGEDGKILKQVPGKPVYTATLVKYAELLCERPCGQGVLNGIII
jgi:hypothetical protein